ncbi:MAG TPA: hypothetical protein ENN66_11275 [Proteobacteria bacterium]|nr:hypothetical protein [Pseudomonadota bacterium]
MGVSSDFSAGSCDLQFAWLRPYRDEVKDPDSEVQDLDACYGRVNFKPAPQAGVGLFGVYFKGDSDRSDPATYATITSQNYQLKKFNNNYELDLFTLGCDGQANVGSFFCNWDFMYQTGSIDNANFKESYNGWDYLVVIL